MVTTLRRSLRPRRAIAVLAAAVVVVLGGLAGVTAAASADNAAASKKHHNVVFVLTDDLSSNLIRYMPHVQALQKAGTSFANYSVTDSLCCPSRSSIYTGRYPHNTKVFTNTPPDGGFGVFNGRGEEKSTFGTDLQKAGYRTAMMGKYMNGYQPDMTIDGKKNYVPPGWDDWAVTGNGYGQYNYTLNHNGKLEKHGKKPADYLNNVLSTKANKFVNDTADAKKPFMLEVASFTPHAPYTPAPQDKNKFPNVKAPRGPAFDTLPTHAPSWLKGHAALTAAQQKKIDQGFRKRVQAVQSVDRLIAGLQKTLTKAGVAKNTTVVFSSDNGYHMGQYRLAAGKMTAFDTDVNVPLIAAGAGVSKGRTVQQPAENIDLRPTFDGLAGLTAPSQVDGRSLAPLLAGKKPADWRTTSLVEHHGPDTVPGDPDRATKASGNPTTYDALRTADYTYVEYANGEREFYNRTLDPHQLHNVAGSLSSSQLAKLHARTTALTACHGRSSCHDADGG